MTNTKMELVGGPSREELFDALRLGHEGRKTYFTIAPRKDLPDNPRFRVGPLKISVRVTGVSEEDGSGNNWLFKLYDEHSQFGTNSLHGYINTTTRQGWVARLVE